MKKLWLVFKYEYLHHVLRKRFLFGVLSVPLLVGVSIGLGLLSVVLGTDRRPVGIVDNAGILNGALTNPYQNEGSVARTRFQLFTSTVDAQTTLDQRDIQGFYTIDSDYINTGSVTLTAPSALEGRVSSDLVNLLKYKLLKDQSDQIQVRLYDGPQITIRSTSDDRAAGESNIMGIILPIVAGILFIVTINISGGYLLQAVVDEKENRTMEIILTAVSTDQLMAGKILGNLSVGLTQLIIWLAATALGAFFFIEMQADASSFATGGTFLGMLALTALPAFVLVAALMAMLGAIATEAREAQQISGIFSIPLFVPLWFSYAILEHPNSALSIGFSLFPLTSPMTLPLRVAFSNVPAWQIALSLLILVISALGAVWLASRAFRLGMLRYGKKLTLRDLFQKAG